MNRVTFSDRQKREFVQHYVWIAKAMQQGEVVVVPRFEWHSPDELKARLKGQDVCKHPEVVTLKDTGILREDAVVILPGCEHDAGVEFLRRLMAATAEGPITFARVKAFCVADDPSIGGADHQNIIDDSTPPLPAGGEVVFDKTVGRWRVAVMAIDGKMAGYQWWPHVPGEGPTQTGSDLRKLMKRLNAFVDSWHERTVH